MIKYINHNELQRALLLCHAADVPVCIIGGVGCGKTTAVEDFVKKIDSQTEEDYHLWKIFLGLVDPTEIGGIPYRSDDEILRYMPPCTLPYNNDAHGVILGDEFDRSDPETQNAFNQVLLGREIHGNKISDNAFVVLTMNGTSDRYTTELSEAARNRICTLFMSSNSSESLSQWDKWAKVNNINPTIRGFAHYRSDLIEVKEDFEELAFMTPRSRDMAARILDAVEQVSIKTDDILLPVLAGLIGHGPASELIAFRMMEKNLPNLKEMLCGPESFETHPCWEEPSQCYAIGTALGAMITEADYGDAVSAVKLIRYMPDEIGAWAIRNIIEVCPAVITSKEYIKTFEEMKDLL